MNDQPRKLYVMLHPIPGHALTPGATLDETELPGGIGDLEAHVRASVDNLHDIITEEQDGPGNGHTTYAVRCAECGEPVAYASTRSVDDILSRASDVVLMSRVEYNRRIAKARRRAETVYFVAGTALASIVYAIAYWVSR